MIARIPYKNQLLQVDLSTPIDISIPMGKNEGPLAWYVDRVKIKPVQNEQFNGSVAAGGAVNFNDIAFNPHGNGTHTECCGHITQEVYSVNAHLKQFVFWARLVTITPAEYRGESLPDMKPGDRLIEANQIEEALGEETSEALVIRTLPNHIDKKNRNYSNSNPPYLTSEAMRLIRKRGVKHLLIDTPSVDREEDGGLLSAHHIFWNVPESPELDKTITEMIFVPDEVPDGLYLLNLQIAPFVNDASPSKPVLYKPVAI